MQVPVIFMHINIYIFYHVTVCCYSLLLLCLPYLRPVLVDLSGSVVFSQPELKTKQFPWTGLEIRANDLKTKIHNQYTGNKVVMYLAIEKWNNGRIENAILIIYLLF